MNKNMRNTKFTTKEEYIQYRKDWKEEYMTLSQTIRDYKLIRALRNRSCGKAMQMIGGTLTYDNVNNYFRCAEQNIKEDTQLQSLLEKYKNSKKTLLELLQKDARTMMDELTNAKIESNKQYLVSKQLINA